VWDKRHAEAMTRVLSDDRISLFSLALLDLTIFIIHSRLDECFLSITNKMPVFDVDTFNNKNGKGIFYFI
jgi:hypothetical protein